MKKFLLLTSILLASYAISVAQSYRGYRPSPVAPSQIRFTDTIHDFGIINEVDGIVSYSFEYENVSDKPYQIASVSVSCGCTTSEYSKEVLAPGKSSAIKVHFDPINRPGEFEKVILLASTTNRGVYDKILICGDVNPRPRTIEDNFPIYLGGGLRISDKAPKMEHITLGTVDTTYLDMINISDNQMTVVLDRGTLPYYSTLVANPATLSPGGQGQIMVITDASMVENCDMIKAYFKVHAQGTPVNDSVYIKAFVVDDFSDMNSADPDTLPISEFNSTYYHFGAKNPGQKASRDFGIRNTGGSPIRIRKIITSSPQISYTIDKTEIQKGEIARLNLELHTQDIPVAMDGSMTRFTESAWVITNEPTNPVREIKLVVSLTNMEVE